MAPPFERPFLLCDVKIEKAPGGRRPGTSLYENKAIFVLLQAYPCGVATWAAGLLGKRSIFGGPEFSGLRHLWLSTFRERWRG